MSPRSRPRRCRASPRHHPATSQPDADHRCTTIHLPPHWYHDTSTSIPHRPRSGEDQPHHQEAGCIRAQRTRPSGALSVRARQARPRRENVSPTGGPHPGSMTIKKNGWLHGLNTFWGLDDWYVKVAQPMYTPSCTPPATKTSRPPRSTTSGDICRATSKVRLLRHRHRPRPSLSCLTWFCPSRLNLLVHE